MKKQRKKYDVQIKWKEKINFTEKKGEKEKNDREIKKKQ